MAEDERTGYKAELIPERRLLDHDAFIVVTDAKGAEVLRWRVLRGRDVKDDIVDAIPKLMWEGESLVVQVDAPLLFTGPHGVIVRNGESGATSSQPTAPLPEK